MWGNDEFFAPIALPIGQEVIDFDVVPATAAGPVTHALAVATAAGQVRLYSNFAGLPATLPAPVVLNIPGVTQVALGVRHGLALTAAGHVFAWGENAAGQLGTGTFIDQPAGTTVRSIALGDIASIEAHGRSSFAVGADGRFWRWGEDADLGNLLSPDSPSQTLAVGLSNVIFDSGNPGDDWWTRFFSIDELQDDMLVGDEADPDDEGIPNLLEYALDTNPRTPDLLANFLAIDEETVSAGGSSNDGPAATSLEPGQRYARLRLTRGTKRSDLAYEFQFSDELEVWFGGLDYFFVSLDVEESLVALDLTPIPSRTQRFYRLSVYRR